ncbi:MAG: LysR family transcriptional regulator [Rhizobiales bacterium]|nr:LysR family transcriptional regulator [Hyphomicrobiales bacterium]
MGAALPGDLPTLKQLRLLLELDKADGIAGAGHALGMSPSATSHALKALETNLGAPIIDRNAPGVELTYAGRLILPHVRDMFASLKLIQTMAHAEARLETGVLRLGSLGITASLKLLPPILDVFRKRYPGVEVFVIERTDLNIEQALVDRKIEIGIIILPNERFDTQVLATDELVAVLPAKHELAAAQTVSLRDLARYPFILTQAGSGGFVSKTFARAGIEPRVTHELSQLTSIFEFVARGQGVSVIASSAMPEKFEGIVFRSLKPRTIRRVGLACLNEKRLSPAAAALWKQVRRNS